LKAYICGIDHEIQRYDGKRDAVLKQKYEELLGTLVRGHGIQLIGDETYERKNAISEHVADTLKIRWLPIEMSLKAREELGIAHEQGHERYECVTQNGSPIGFKYKRVLSDAIRE